MSKYAPRGPWKATVGAQLPAPREGFDAKYCQALSKTRREQCKRHPIPGGTVCRYHGGAAPQVKRKAMERLLACQDMAIDKLIRLVKQDDFPSTAYQAVRDILDRTMGKPAETLDMNHHVTHDVTAILKQRFERRRALSE